MVSIKQAASLMAMSALFVSASLQAKEVYECKNANLVRKLAINYTTEGATVPCNVVYTKEDGTTQELWNAQGEAGYCERKADEFAEKQRGWGWDCQAVGEQAAAAAPAAAAPAPAAPVAAAPAAAAPAAPAAAAPAAAK